MRVLHLVNAALPDVASGYTHRTEAVLAAQRRAGLSPTVVALDLGRREATPERIDLRDGVAHHHLCYPSRPSLSGGLDAGLRALLLQTAARLPGEASRRAKLAVLARWAASQLEPLIEESAFDVLQAHSPFAVAAVADVLSRRFRLPWIYELRGLWHETAVAQGSTAAGSVRHRLDARAEASLARRAAGCLPIGEALAEEVSGWGGRVLGVAPNVVDAERFSPGPKDRELAEAIGLGGGPVVGYVGSLRPLEGIEACFEGLRGFPEATLLIVGEGPSREALEREASRRGLRHRVLFTGRVSSEAVPNYYRLIDIFWVTRAAHPVTRLVPPLKPLEAMATGLPVICSKLPALVELVGRSGERGLTYPPEDPSRLASLTRALWQDPDRRRHLGQAGRTWVETTRSLDALGRVYARAFEGVRSTQQ